MARKKIATAQNGRNGPDFIDIGGLKIKKARHDEILKHVNGVLKETKDFNEILKRKPPRNRGGGQIKVYDDDIDDIIKAKKEFGWSVPEIVILFKQIGRPIGPATIHRVLAGEIKKGRGLRRDAESR